MNKIILIFRHEFFRTVRRTGFIVLTLALPALALLGIGVTQIVSGLTKPAPVAKIGYVDEAGNFSQSVTRGGVTLVEYSSKQAATQAIVSRDIAEYFIIPKDFLSAGTLSLFTTRNQLEPPASTIDAVNYFISINLLSGKVPEQVINVIEQPLRLVSTTITPSGEPAPRQNGFANLVVPGIFSFLMMMSLIFSSQYVLQSLGEEKENRLMEILLSSVSTRQLLAGKVAGIGAAGLLQVSFWLVSLPLLLNFASSSIGGFISSIKIPADFWALGIIYFVLGYFFFAVLSSSIAAVTSTTQEGQGIASIYTLFAVSPFWFLSLVLLYPENPAWIVLSAVPFCAPVLVMLRLGISGVPVWQLAVSIAVLLLSITGGLLLAGKLLRAYILMYGKRPGLKEIVRNLRS